ncbi:hypothetical protein Sjap_006183 [Stephania japonica]|uniref:Beta-glucosidase n=1 Tax=Stephania japonica TaxID=461633 RepID=A0AAP0K800_9MAGN
MAFMTASQIAPMAEVTLSRLHKSTPGGLFFSRKDFPKDFVFGAGSSAYQIEGAANEGGRGKSIWDTFTHNHPEKITGGANGDVAVDGYNRYKEDVQIAKDIGLDVYRFSISWSRVLPRGKKIKGLPNEGVNEEGIKYYSDLIDELKSNGQDLISFTMPPSFNPKGIHAPGRCSPSAANKWEGFGNSAKEPYIVAHHMLLAHAAAFNLYKASHDGKIGVTANCHWFMPYSETENDKAAAQRTLDFTFGWFADPLFFGEYPKCMRAVMDERLKNVIDVTQVKRVKGTLDFIGVNYYTARYCKQQFPKPNDEPRFSTDCQASTTGCDDLNKDDDPGSIIESIVDVRRVTCYKGHIDYLLSARKNGVNVKGFVAWSLTDNFEWAYGYSYRFGINYVDYKDGLKRYPKLSSFYLKNSLMVEKFNK